MLLFECLSYCASRGSCVTAQINEPLFPRALLSGLVAATSPRCATRSHSKAFRVAGKAETIKKAHRIPQGGTMATVPSPESRSRGRDAGCPAPPAQIRTSGATAYGSYRGYGRGSPNAASRTRCSPANALTQLCIWDAAVCPVFSLVGRLPSMPSAGE